MASPILVEDSPSVIIIGGGVAGLTAALHLAERGVRPLVLEAEPYYPGGRVAGGDEIEVNGWRFRLEHGVHAIWSPYRNLQAMLARHGLRPMFVPAQEETWLYKRRGRVRAAPIGRAIRESWLPAPLHYLNLFLRPSFLAALDWRDWLSLFNVWYGLVLAIGIDPLREGQPMEGMWLSDLVNGWPSALRALIIGLARNGLAGRPEEIPMAGFIAFLRFYTLLRRDAWAFSYLPADGGTSLIDPLVSQVRALGGQVELGQHVTRLEREGEAWRVCLEGTPLAGRHVILATDAPNTRAILEASPALDTRELYWPRGLPSAIVRVWFERAPNAGAEAGVFSGEFTGHNFFWLHRIQDTYMRWHKATGGSAIEVHVYGAAEGSAVAEALAAPDAILQARVLNDVHSAFPELGGGVLGQHFQRNAPAHTLLSLGPAGRHLGLQTPWPGLYCCGDWVRHPTPAFFLERACVTGLEAANVILGEQDLPTWPLLDYLPPEPLAGWIEKLMRRGRRALRPKHR